VGLSEAAWSLLEFPLVIASTKVHYIEARPTSRRVQTARAMGRGGIQSCASVPPIRKYESRPQSLEDLTFFAAFTQYEVRKEKMKTRACVGACALCVRARVDLTRTVQRVAITASTGTK